MNLIPRNSILNFDSIFNDFYQGFGRPALGSLQSDTLTGMRVDVHEGDKQFEINAELPGVKKKDISITLQDGVLSISASKNTESTKREKGKVIWQECSRGSVTRRFTVGKNVTEKEIKANFEDGVLTLDVPKKQGSRSLPNARRIPIK